MRLRCAACADTDCCHAVFFFLIMSTRQDMNRFVCWPSPSKRSGEQCQQPLSKGFSPHVRQGVTRRQTSPTSTSLRRGYSGWARRAVAVAHVSLNCCCKQGNSNQLAYQQSLRSLAACQRRVVHQVLAQINTTDLGRFRESCKSVWEHEGKTTETQSAGLPRSAAQQLKPENSNLQGCTTYMHVESFERQQLLPFFVAPASLRAATSESALRV